MQRPNRRPDVNPSADTLLATPTRVRGISRARRCALEYRTISTSSFNTATRKRCPTNLCVAIGCRDQAIGIRFTGSDTTIGIHAMHKLSAALILSIPFALLPRMVSAKGCVKGAVVGGVAGHVAGHHGVIGAAAGCVIQRHREKVKDQKAASSARPAAPAQSPAPPPPAAPNGAPIT